MATKRLTALTLCILGLAGCNWHSAPNHFFDDMYAQDQFFDRLAHPGLYLPDPAMIQKLDLDDPVLFRKYREQPDAFTEKLKQMHVDINTVMVRPDPANIRVLALQSGDPATSWTLHLLTGDDTAQQLEDGIHLRRRGFPDKLVCCSLKHKKDPRNHGESSTVLWRPNGRGGWKIDPNGSGRVHSVSISLIYETRRIRSSEPGQGRQETVPHYQLDCAALRQFVQPLRPGESTREITLAVDVPVSPNYHPTPGAVVPPCVIDLLKE